MKVLELENTPLGTLRQMARDLDVTNANRLKKEDLIDQVTEVIGVSTFLDRSRDAKILFI